MEKFAAQASLIVVIVLVVCAVPRWAHAQTPTGDCIDYNGHVVRCTARSGGSSGGSTYTGPSEAEIEAERARAAERERLAEAQRKLEQQRKLDAEKKKQEEADWKHGVAEAASSLKGVSSDDMQLKGVNTGSFGLKGTSPDEAASNPLYGIKARKSDNYSRDVSTAWKQVHCAAELAGYAVADLQKIETGAADARELDEIKYLAGEANNALNGNPVGVQCSAAPAMPSMKGFDPVAMEPVTAKLLTRTVHDAENIVSSRQRIADLQQKLADLKAQKPGVNAHAPINPTPAQQSSQTNQSSPLTADQKHINEVFQQQKANEAKKSDYLALLRETQRALNEANSQKITSSADAEKVQKETQAIMTGQLPNARTGMETQSKTKKLSADQ